MSTDFSDGVHNEYGQVENPELAFDIADAEENKGRKAAREIEKQAVKALESAPLDMSPETSIQNPDKAFNDPEDGELTRLYQAPEILARREVMARNVDKLCEALGRGLRNILAALDRKFIAVYMASIEHSMYTLSQSVASDDFGTVEGVLFEIREFTRRFEQARIFGLANSVIDQILSQLNVSNREVDSNPSGYSGKQPSEEELSSLRQTAEVLTKQDLLVNRIDELDKAILLDQGILDAAISKEVNGLDAERILASVMALIAHSMRLLSQATLDDNIPMIRLMLVNLRGITRQFENAGAFQETNGMLNQWLSELGGEYSPEQNNLPHADMDILLIMKLTIRDYLHSRNWPSYYLGLDEQGKGYAI